jgi:hypothetical protein
MEKYYRLFKAMARAYALATAWPPACTRELREEKDFGGGGKGLFHKCPFTYEKLPQTPTPNSIREIMT